MDIKEEKPVQQYVHPSKRKAMAGTWMFIAVTALSGYFILRLHLVSLPNYYQQLPMHLALATAAGALVLLFSVLSERFILSHPRQSSQGYNLIQAIRLVSVIIVILIFISFLFHNWYAAVTSLGLISLILGFALQTPISSFIGWLYIIARSPYHAGDRIQINGYKGDVVEIGYLDTTLWEFGGDYLTNDLPSGRLIRFPNSLVLQSAVFNYSWYRFPYIWNEIPFHIAYESDLQWVEDTIRAITKNELGEQVVGDAASLKDLFEQMPGGEMPVKPFPIVSFRTNANTWLEVTVTYLVEPKKAAEMRSRILKKVVAGLMEQPDKVLFPKTNSR